MKDMREEMMSDSIVKVSNSIIQHGKLNNRIYLMSYGEKSPHKLIEIINSISEENSYGKIFAKVPSYSLAAFITDGYSIEAVIPDYYMNNEKSDAFLLGKYRDLKRSLIGRDELVNFQNLFCTEKNSVSFENIYKSGFTFTKASEQDISELSKLYADVFCSYPFPINDPEYLLQTMKDNVSYYIVRSNNKIIAASSCETDIKNMAVEMTDFAVLPEYRGKKISQLLLTLMENDMKNKKFRVLYTISRLKEFGINKIFYNENYKYSGTLINNTNISGGLESMNVWYKNT